MPARTALPALYWLLGHVPLLVLALGLQVLIIMFILVRLLPKAILEELAMTSPIHLLLAPLRRPLTAALDARGVDGEELFTKLLAVAEAFPRLSAKKFGSCWPSGRFGRLSAKKFGRFWPSGRFWRLSAKKLWSFWPSWRFRRLSAKKHGPRGFHGGLVNIAYFVAEAPQS
jgi:hypothetical protein